MANRSALDRASIVAIVTSLLLSLLLAAEFPMMTDEAYYIDWARSMNWPRWGFFDHPPFVSWLGVLSRYFDHVLAARILVIVSGLVSAYFIWRLARQLTPERSLAAVALTTSSIGGMAGAFLLTPDSGVTLAWIIAIHEAFFAISRDPKRWVTAGIATGVGFLSKYTMVLIGPVFLLALLKDGRKQLRSPWPYLGGLACLIVIYRTCGGKVQTIG
jgi:4-amino-4-deoxy-L-arabinose transferase-like glycosyltransferase